MKPGVVGMAVTLTTLFACGCTDKNVFEGKYSISYEASTFQSCDENERWWLLGNLDTLERFREMENPEVGVVKYGIVKFVKLEGTLSPEGRYGHMGKYTRELTVSRVIEVRPWKESDCKNKD
jgi:hypothetical protein